MTTHIRNALIAMIRGDAYESPEVQCLYYDGDWDVVFDGDPASSTVVIYHRIRGSGVGVYAHAAWTCLEAFELARDTLAAAGDLFGIEIPAQLLETVEPEYATNRLHYHVQLVGPLSLAALRASLSTDTTTVVEP